MSARRAIAVLLTVDLASVLLACGQADETAQGHSSPTALAATVSTLAGTPTLADEAQPADADDSATPTPGMTPSSVPATAPPPTEAPAPVQTAPPPTAPPAPSHRRHHRKRGYSSRLSSGNRPVRALLRLCKQRPERRAASVTSLQPGLTALRLASSRAPLTQATLRPGVGRLAATLAPNRIGTSDVQRCERDGANPDRLIPLAARR